MLEWKVQTEIRCHGTKRLIRVYAVCLSLSIVVDTSTCTKTDLSKAYCPFNISWKDVFCLAFYFKWKYFVLTDHILSETICLFCFCVLFSNIYTKIKATAKSWSDLCNFYSKVIFCNFCPRKYFLLFFAEFELLMFYNNIVKISEKLKKWNLLKIWLQVTYPTDFCTIWLHFYHGKKWKYLIF